jgi:hypothetical protein
LVSLAGVDVVHDALREVHGVNYSHIEIWVERKADVRIILESENRLASIGDFTGRFHDEVIFALVIKVVEFW